MSPHPEGHPDDRPPMGDPIPGPDDHVMHGPFAVVLTVDEYGAWDITTTLGTLETLRVLHTALHQAARGLS